MVRVNDTVGFRLKVARQAACLTQAEVAARLGMRASAIQKWEGDTAEPRFTTLKRVAGIYGVSVGWIMGEAPVFADQEKES